MKKSEMNSLVAGVKIQSKKDLAVYTIVGIDLEQGKVILDNGKLYTMGTIQRWYNLYEEEIPEVVEPKITQEELDNITPGDWVIKVSDNSRHQITARVTETQKFGLDGHKVVTFKDIQQNYILDEEQDNTEEQTNTSDLQDNTTQDNEIHEDTEQTGQQDVVEGNTATTSDKITKDDIIYIIEHSNCDAVVKKQYIGAYREDYKGAVVMVRTTKKGNTHIDMKQGIFNSLAESTRNRLEANYNAKVYDSTRGYIRLFEVDDLAVLQDLILTALQIAV